MAGGQDHSVNLSGMFDGIQTSLQKMGETGGMFADSFRQAFKPGIDPSSPESYQKAAEWASNNHRPEEAKQYRDEATRVSLANTDAQLKEDRRALSAKVQEALQKAGNARDRGDLVELREAEDEMNALIQEAPLESHENIRAGATAIGNMRTEAKGHDAANTATGARKLATLLKDPEFQKAQAENLPVLEDKLAALLQEPETLEAYNQQVEQEAVRSTAELEATTQAETRAVETKIHKLVLVDGKLDEAIEYASKSKYPDIVKPYVELAKSRLELKKAMKDGSPEGTFNYRLEDARSAVKNLRRFDGGGFDSGATQFEDSIARVENDKNMTYDEKASVLKKLRDQLFQKDRELTNSSFAAKQEGESERRRLEIKAADSVPNSTELKSFRDQQNDETGLFQRRFGKSMSNQDFANAYMDVQRHNFGVPTAYYKVKDGKIVFKDGQPVARDKNNGYRKAAQIGLDVSSAPDGSGKRGVPQAVFDLLTPEEQTQVYICEDC